MAEQYSLRVEKRTGTGKNVMSRLRHSGYVPGVYYTKNGENIQVQVIYGELEKVFARAHKSNIVDLAIQDGPEQVNKPVLIWDIQKHPAKDLMLHVDFYGVDLKQEMEVDVGLEVTGESKGVAAGGIVTFYRDTIRVSCLPSVIPDQILIDVSELDINDSILVEDVVLPEGVTLKESEEGFAVVGVSPPEKTLEEEELEAAEAEESGPGEEGETAEGASGTTSEE
ncbi:MAG: 50S ribosomal protein L25 [Desulfohalobiaceae bacterium]|nr:50S ribosomal protein L25 [Desulfohalobiaceae bacterium]